MATDFLLKEDGDSLLKEDGDKIVLRYHYTQAVAGTLTSAGAVVKKISKSLSGALSSSGAVTRIVKKVLGGTLSFAGSVSTSVVTFLSAIINFIKAPAGQVLLDITPETEVQFDRDPDVHILEDHN